MNIHRIVHIVAFSLSLALPAQELFTTAPPPEKSRAEMVAEALVLTTNAGLADRVARLKTGWVMLWEDESATPAEILAALGPNALKLFQAAGAARTDLEAIAKIAGTTVEEMLGDKKYLSPALPVVFHANGTVTIKE